MDNLYALIMAGGGGTRLWPESRSALPKQFTRLLRDRSLIQIAHDRIAPLIPPDRILVVTGRRYASLVHEQLPDLPADNVIAEPSGRNTAPAIGLGAIRLRRRDPQAVMAVLTADHILRKEPVFRQAIQRAAQAAASGALVTLGITPTEPETGYGYIERGDAYQNTPLYQVKSFREKPDLATAERFVSSGRFFWNSGMFIWSVDAILQEIEKQLPDLSRSLQAIEATLGTPDEVERTGAIWDEIQAVSIDYGIMEKAENVLVLPVDPDWIDVGSWSAVYDVSLADDNPESPDHNVVLSGEHLALESAGCLVRSQKLVATVGVRDLVVVETDDAILICPRDQAQKVKDVVNILKEQAREEYL